MRLSGAVFRDADTEAKDRAQGKVLEPVVQPVRTALAPVAVVATPAPQASPPKPRSATAAVYL